eukprot:GFUD01005918.1.p1 GENE.GFUD01005918.1~~GFUD01005918.1.p1  ORF type:complete len:548 (-),score=136.63 GFUD01005918.1:677-2320(-)
MEILHCAILLAVLVQAQCEVAVEGFESVEVREGEEAILSCTTPSDILFCTFRSPTDETFTMKSGLPYEEGRIVYHGEDEKRECGMKITDVKEKDNGEWKCLLTALLDGQAKKGEKAAIITVAKPPSDIHIEVDGETTAAVIVNYPENKERKVKCVAAGGRPSASFSWMLGEDQFSGPVEDLENTVNEDGTLTQAQVLTYESQPAHNGKQLTCIVNHRGYSEDQLSAQQNKVTLDLDVQFQPVAADKPQEFYNLAIGKEHVILMSFRAHPKPSEVHWALSDGIEVAEGSESMDTRFKADILAEGPSDGMYTARLTMNPVKPEDAGTTSELIVTNELGTTKYPFTLSVGDKPAAAPAVSDSLDGGVPSPTEAGSGPVIAIVIVAIIIIVVIVVAVIARSQGMLCFADPPKTEEDKEKAVEKEEGSDTESAEHVEGAKDEKDAASVEDGTLTNNNSKKSVTARVSSLLSAMKKTVGSKKEKYTESESEVKVPLQESEEKKEGDEEEGDKKDDSIVYADLDKSAMSEGTRPSVTVENELTEYAEIKPQTKE